MYCRLPLEERFLDWYATVQALQLMVDRLRRDSKGDNESEQGELGAHRRGSHFAPARQGADVSR
jgi:hypothetical protein